MHDFLPFRAVVAFGSNIDAPNKLCAALALLERRGPVIARSCVYRSPAVGRETDPAFLNGAIEIRTAIRPHRFKRQVLRPIEEELGRKRASDRFAPRTIDLDLVLFLESGGQPYPVGRPWVDPDLQRYAHIALPVADLDPDRLHPLTGQRFGALAAQLLAAAATSLTVVELPSWVPRRLPLNVGPPSPSGI